MIYNYYRTLKREARKRKWVRRLNWANNKIQAIAWIAAAGFVLYKTNFFRQVWENPHVNRFFLDIALVCLGINISIMIYLTVYLPYIAKIEEEWDTYCPKIIPVMSFSSVISFIW